MKINLKGFMQFRQNEMAESSERCSKLLGSIKGGEFLDWPLATSTFLSISKKRGTTYTISVSIRTNCLQNMDGMKSAVYKLK
jgi:hypothetical protein